VWLGCFIVGAFLVLSISAYYLIRQRHLEFAKRSFAGAMFLALFSCLAMFISGHFQARSVYEHQPAKMAAFEGHFNSGVGDLTLFGIPDAARQSIDFKVAIPGGLSFLLFDRFDADVTGLDRFKTQDRPPVALPFLAYHLMIGFGVGLTLLSMTTIYFWFRGSIFQKRWLLWALVIAIVPAIIANESGWVAAEVGRQPWIVYPPLQLDQDGQPVVDEDGAFAFEESLGLRTGKAISKAISAEQVLTSIIMFGLVYCLLGFLWLFLLNRKIQAGPIYSCPAHSKSGDGAMSDVFAETEGLTGSR
jgi:cytochrome d ubiquinol oxidase subunit I